MPADPAPARTEPAAAARPSALRAWTFRIGIAVLFIAVLGGLAAWQLIGQQPLWWRPVNAEDPRTIERARAVENLLINEIYLSREADPDYRPVNDGSWRSGRWTMRIPAAEANAWLNARLPKWMANQQNPVRLPPELEGLRVEFQDGQILVGAQVRAGGEARIFTATLQPKIAADGALWLPAEWVHIGRLPIPVPMLLRTVGPLVRRLIPPSVLALPATDAMGRAFAGQEPIIPRPVMKLEDGRRVRLLGVASHDGVLEITCQTERP